MTTTTYLACAATTIGLAMGASPGLQILKTLKRKHSGDVSMPYLGIIALGTLIWTSYGIALGNLAVIITNGVGFVFASSALAIVYHYRHGLTDGSLAGSK